MIMKLVDDKGYYLNDLKKQLSKRRFDKLAEWLRGQTVFRDKGKVCIYRWDYERFLQGKPVID